MSVEAPELRVLQPVPLGAVTPVRLPVASRERVHLHWPRVTAGRVIFLLAFTAYVVAGAVLVFGNGSYGPDTAARTANAYYVLFSRDPHLAAIGFVWNPLSSLVVMPLLPLKFLWPPITQDAFAATIVSAAFMAGVVVQTRAILIDLHVRRAAVVVLTVALAVHPMVIYYGANGMSEGLFLFTLLVTTRRLMRWLDRGRLQDLVVAGFALAAAYLARNEAVAAAAFACGLVLVVGYLRAGGDRRQRLTTGVADAALLGTPFAVAFVCWAAISWVIVGSPFEHFTSAYGNSSWLKVMRDVGSRELDPSSLPYVAGEVAAMSPLLPGIAVLAALQAARRRRAAPLGAIAVLGGTLTFAVVAALMGQTAGWFRFYIVAVPLTVVLAGSALSRSPQKLHRRRRDGWAGLAAAAVAVVAVGPSVAASGAAMLDTGVAPEESLRVGPLFGVDTRRAGETDLRDESPRMEHLAQYLDAKKLEDGSILMDTFGPCAPMLFLRSERPQQFVITSDRDFERTLYEPVLFGVRFILVPDSQGIGRLDAINRSYPSMYEAGAGLATLEKEFPPAGFCPAFRLYRLPSSPLPG